MGRTRANTSKGSADKGAPEPNRAQFASPPMKRLFATPPMQRRQRREQREIAALREQLAARDAELLRLRTFVRAITAALETL